MTNQEYIELHPEKFKDDIDKWLLTEFSIIGGCSSAQGSMEYSVARMVAEKMKQQMIDKACEWINLHIGELNDKYVLSEEQKTKFKNILIETFDKENTYLL